MKKEMGYDLPLVEQASIEDFCIDEQCCPARFSSPSYPSPTSCLPLETLEQVRSKITAANELLLDLALDEERPSEEIFRKAFSGLEGLKVEVLLSSDNKLRGKVHTVGFDFVVLLDKKSEMILPYRQIIKIKPCGRFAEPDHVAPLLNIDSCLRRDITFCFGMIVASSPELLHLFFRMRFNIYLLLLEAKRIEITIDHTTIQGFLTDVNKETIVVKTDKDLKVISTNKISLIKKNRE